MKNITVLFLLFGLLACRKETLDIQQASDSGLHPAFNFNIENISHHDTVPVGGVIIYNLYIRQQLVYVAGRKYYLSFTLPQGHDGEALINGKTLRSGDLVVVNYDAIVKNNYRVKFTYSPSDRRPASYPIQFACQDEAGKILTYTKQLHLN